MARRLSRGVPAALVIAGFLSRASFGARSQAGHAPVLTLTWEPGHTLNVRGAGFAPNERIQLSLAASGQDATSTGSGGSVVQRSANFSQNISVSVTAGADGAFRMAPTLSAPAGTVVAVRAVGQTGRSAEAQTVCP